MIGQPLAFGCLHCRNCALLICLSESRAAVISEIEFREIAIEVLLAAMLISQKPI